MPEGTAADPGCPSRIAVRQGSVCLERDQTASLYCCSSYSDCSMTRTIQLRDATYDALRSFKVSGMTFDDVIRRLMEHHDADRFHHEYYRWQKRVLANMRKSGDFKRP